MSLPARHPLYGVRSRLAEIVRERDAAGLAGLLRGEGLPALGGDPDPADLVHEAMGLPPFEAELDGGLAELTASLCGALAQGDASADSLYRFNLFLLASYLSPSRELFDALEPVAGVGDVGLQLRQALVYQQVDDRLESYWLELIRQEPEATQLRLDDERKLELLDAWTGLLWIPPSGEDREAGRVVHVDRLVEGLLTLHDAVADTADGVAVLRHALRRLNDAFPRSHEFWSERLSQRLARWPELLQDVATERWPMLAVETEADVVPSRALEVWEAMSPEDRSRLENAASAGDAEAWNSLWDRLFFSPAPRRPDASVLGVAAEADPSCLRGALRGVDGDGRGAVDRGDRPGRNPEPDSGEATPATARSGPFGGFRARFQGARRDRATFAAARPGQGQEIP